MWNELAGFARIEPIKRAELVQRYVSKYVIKGGEIDLGGPLMQRRLEQAPIGSDATTSQRGGRGLYKNSVSVPAPPARGEVGGYRVTPFPAIASHLPSLTGCGASRSGLSLVAHEHSANEGAAISPECAPATA
jgi:hypothetical protein